MSEPKPKPRRRRQKVADLGPALPMPAAKKEGKVFRRGDRSGRLYIKLWTDDGKPIIRSTGVHTTAAAQTYLRLAKQQLEKAGKL